MSTSPPSRHPISLFLLSERNPAERALQLQAGAGFHTMSLAGGGRALVAFTTLQAAQAYPHPHGLSAFLPFRLKALHELEGLVGALRTAGITRIVVDSSATGEPIGQDLDAFVQNLRNNLKIK